MVRILKNDDFVIRDITRLDLGIGPGTGHPQSTPRVPYHVDGIGQHGIRRKEVGFVSR